MSDWVLSQVQPYPMLVAGGDAATIRLPRILLVHPSRSVIFAHLEAEVGRCCGAYDRKRLVERSRTWFEYDTPDGVGRFAVVRAQERDKLR